MQFILGLAVGIVLTALVPTVGEFTRESLNTAFETAQQATEPSTQQKLEKLVDKYTQ
jgi:hypothetical protein